MKIDESLKVYQEVSKLKNLKRKGWEIRGVPERLESVAEHCFAMNTLAILFNLENNLNLDMKKVYEMINIHEYGEIIVGDITPFDNVTKEEKHDREFQAINKVLDTFPDKTYLIELWNEFEKKETNEAIFVFLLDKFQSVLQAHEYASKYNMDDLYKEFLSWYQKLISDPLYKNYIMEENNESH